VLRHGLATYWLSHLSKASHRQSLWSQLFVDSAHYVVGKCRVIDFGLVVGRSIV
jgi:hypothetical protein